jgi:hypothetical protein
MLFQATIKLALTAVILTLGLTTSGQYSEGVTVSDTQNISSLRAEINNAVFGSETIPELSLDSQVHKYISVVAGVYNSSHLGRFDMGTVTMKNGFTSKICFFKPVKSNGLNIPIIYHTGHGYTLLQEDLFVNNQFDDSLHIKVIDFFLSKGFDVIGIDMPLFGANKHPAQVTENNRTYPIFGHNDVMYLDHPLYYFLAPVASAVNYLEKQSPQNNFVMLGLSGGGWSTTVYSAMDTRIQLSFPVAGSIPIPLRTQPNDLGDLEQYISPFYDLYNYSTLYFLGSAGSGRMQYQILNKKDHCCFAFDGKKYWVDSVQNALKNLDYPGTYRFYLDTFADNHRISSVAVDTIYTNIMSGLANERLKSRISINSSRVSNSICDNDSLFLSVTDSLHDKIQWYKNGQPIFGAKGDQFNVRNGGDYFARLTNMSGAEANTDTITVIQTFELSRPVITSNNGILSSSYSSGNQWYRDGVALPGDTAATLETDTPGQYTLVVSSGTCTSDPSSPHNIGIVVFPNPTRSQLNVQLPYELGKIRYEIYTTSGTLISAGNFKGQNKIMLPPGIGTGMYLLRLTGNNKWKTLVKFWVK